jgi:hypothetical protein
MNIACVNSFLTVHILFTSLLYQQHGCVCTYLRLYLYCTNTVYAAVSVQGAASCTVYKISVYMSVNVHVLYKHFSTYTVHGVGSVQVWKKLRVQ